MEQARQLLDSGFLSIPDPRPMDRYYYYDFHSWYYREKQERETALLYTDSMMTAIGDIPGVETHYAHALNTRGVLQKELNQYSEALKTFYKAEVFTAKHLDSCASAEIYANLGSVLYEQKNYPSSIEYYYKAVTSTKSCKKKDREYFITIQSCYNSLGLCYERLSEYNRARNYYRKALNFLSQQGRFYEEERSFVQTAKGIILGNLGSNELAAGNFEKAEKSLLESISINDKPGGDIRDATLNKIKLAHVYCRQQNETKARPLIGQAEEYLSYHPDLEMELRLLNLKRDWAEKKGDTGFAYTVLVRMEEAEDSIQLRKKELTGLDVKEALQNLAQQEQLHALRETEEKRSLLLIASIMLAAILGVILYLIRKNLQESKAHVKALNVLNDEIREQSESQKIALKALENSQEETEKVMRIVAHDLRNPIGSIIALSSLLKETNDPDPESLKYLKMIHSLGQDSLGFMEEVLSLRASDARQTKTEENFRELVEYCIGFMKLKAEEKEQHIHLEGPSVRINISRDQVWRLISNLISNAIKFSPKQSEIDLEIRVTDDDVILSVQDYGIGIPETLQDKVFDVLSEARRKGTEGEKPYGLGLSISRQIMEAHNGSIWFESEEGKGTVFYLRFPR